MKMGSRKLQRGVGGEAVGEAVRVPVAPQREREGVASIGARIATARASQARGRGEYRFK
jgi:hypothetical protein